MSTLEVPGARLYYETHGSGPLIVLIPGAAGACDPYKFITASLVSRYNVLLYDRRGFSRSELDGPQDYERRLETDADDVRRLIEYLGDGPAIVFGGSSGAIVAMEVLTRHPAVAGTLVAHEPPAMRVLPDGEQWVDFFVHVYGIYQRAGIDSAMQEFRERAFAESDSRLMALVPKNEFTEANSRYWFEHELRQYPAVRLDIDALKIHSDHIVLMAGRESRGTPCHDVAAALGEKLGRPLLEMPGGHIGYVAKAPDFARELLQLLEAKWYTTSAAKS
jgi:pimeloyl-ACP methyl ester carboxylesterase